MYAGVYNDKKAHEPDVTEVIARAQKSGVEKMIVTAGTLSEAKKALELVAGKGTSRKQRFFYKF